MKNAKLNFGKSLKSLSVLIVFMLIGTIGWAQKNNIKVLKGIKGKSAFEYERLFLPSASLLVGVRSYAGNKRDNKFTNKGTRLTIAYRQYLNAGKDPMSGFYVSPVVSIGQHSVSYLDEPSSGIGLTLFSIGLTAVAGDASYLYFPEEEETITGESKISASSVGVKLGYQKRWNAITMDMGMNISNNSTDDPRGMRVSNGTYRAYNPDIEGRDVDFYLGFGFAF